MNSRNVIQDVFQRNTASRGTLVSCEYQMSTSLQGTGTCTFNNGAKYQVHVGG